MSGYVQLPEGWERLSADGPGPFITTEVFRRPDGSEVRWRSRAHRKSSPVHQGLARKDSEPVWWRPRRRGWWMAVMFSVGSLCFTAGAIASQCHRWVCFRRRSLPWKIVALNLLGSIAFGVSAVASLLEPSSGLPVSARIANGGTALGGICFLIGAVLLMPEAAAEERAAQVRPSIADSTAQLST